MTVGEERRRAVVGQHDETARPGTTKLPNPESRATR